MIKSSRSALVNQFQELKTNSIAALSIKYQCAKRVRDLLSSGLDKQLEAKLVEEHQKQERIAEETK